MLLPARARFAGMALPAALGKALGRADLARAAAGEDAQLLRHFSVLAPTWPHAALTRVADAGLEDARHGAWLRADPAHLRADINGARLLGIGRTVGVERSDVDALLPALRPLFGDAGMALDAPRPERWYLRLAPGASVPAFTPPERALGDDVFEHIPDGPQARRWRTLMSEAQILLHNHPHNARRLEAGQVPINALWFWGSGSLPDAVDCRLSRQYTDDPELLGTARLGAPACAPLDTFSDARASALIDLRRRRDWRELIADWLAPTAAAARRRRVVFDFDNGEVITLEPRQRWRIWRKPWPRLHP